MFTGFASENTPALQIWDFCNTFASTSAVRTASLTDDCAPIQVFRTGSQTTSIRVYLPTAPIEGKQITIINQRYAINNQNIQLFSSDTSGDGASSAIFTLGQGDSVILVYSKQAITNAPAGGFLKSGWISLNKGGVSASNYYAAVVGGNNNSATDAYSFVGGGSNNQANNSLAAVIGGQANTASGAESAVVGGISNTASASDSAIVGGVGNTANSSNGVVVGGNYGTTRAISGYFVISASSSPIIASAGRQQLATLLIGRQTTDATATILTSNTSVASTSNQVILPNNSAYYFRGSVIANVTGGGDTKAWTFDGAIKRGATAASTTIVGSTVTSMYADAGATTWIITVTADTTNGGLAVTVTGQAATTIRWVCKIETTEVTF